MQSWLKRIVMSGLVTGGMSLPDPGSDIIRGTASRVQRVGGATLIDIPRDMAEVFEAVKDGRYVIAFQPGFDPDSGRVNFLEAILHLPTMSSPRSEANVEIASRNGMIVGLGQEMVWETCKLIRKLRSEGMPRVVGSVNLCEMQLLQPDLVQDFLQPSSEWKLPVSALQVEIPWRAYAAHGRALRALREAGVRVGVELPGHGSLKSAWRMQPRPDFLKVPATALSAAARRNGTGFFKRWLDDVQRAGIEVVTTHVADARLCKFAQTFGVDLFQGRYLLREFRSEDLLGLKAAGLFRIRSGSLRGRRSRA